MQNTQIISVTNKKEMTLDEYFAQTPEGHMELINGILREPPAPGYGHQDSSMSLSVQLFTYVKSHNLGIVLTAPMDVVLDKKTVVQPDILFVSSKRNSIITEKNIQGVPDLLVEIVSDSSVHHDTVYKKGIYEKYGVKEYWIVYPCEKIIEVFGLSDMKYQLLNTFYKEDILITITLPGFELKLREIF